MRFLILDHYYPDFIESVYGADPGLADGTRSKQQAARIDAGLFGETQFQVAALAQLGHEALHLPVNVPPTAVCMGRDHDIPLTPHAGEAWRRRRGLYRGPAVRDRPAWLAETLPVHRRLA